MFYPPGNLHAIMALVLMASAANSQTPVSYGKLCERPSCPEAVDIPENYGSSDVCSAEHIATENTVTEVNPHYDPTGAVFPGPADPAAFINSGKRFKPGIFNIEKVEQRSWLDWTDAGDNGWNYFRGGRITYTVKCDNGITYRDTYEWDQKDQYDMNYAVSGFAVDHFCAWSPSHTCSRDESHTNTYESVEFSGFNPDTGPYGRSETRVIAPRGSFSQDLLLPIGRIVQLWSGREVGIPKYYGGVNKLAVPVVMLNGLGYDYRVWGAIPAGEKGSEAWRKGYVADYVHGSLPDVMSRAYGLAKGGGINRNGIYFMNLDPNANFNTTTEPQWLMDRLNSILFDYTGGTGVVPSTFKIDVVCHSSGCLLLREAIRLANAASGLMTQRPQDHIRRIISVNAPNEGTGFAKTEADMVGDEEYVGLPALLSQIKNPNPEEEIMSGFYKIDWSELGWNECGDMDWVCWAEGQVADFYADLGSVLSGSHLDRVDLSLRGGLFGPHKLYYQWVGDPGLVKNYDKPTLTKLRDALKVDVLSMANKVQTQWLTLPNRALDYPKNSSGKYIDFVPFFSDRADMIESGLAREITGGLGSMVCDAGTKGCPEISRIITTVAREKLESAIYNVNTTDALNLNVSPSFRALLWNLKTGWLNHSDMVVEKSSQVWGLEFGKDDLNGSPILQLHKALTYNIHYASVPEGHPDRAVIHGSVQGLTGASQTSEHMHFLDKGATSMGLDLFCGLDDGCRELTGTNRSPVYMGPATILLMPRSGSDGVMAARTVPTQSVALSGDFQVYPQILSPDYAGVGIQNDAGENMALAGYDPAIGTWVWTQSGGNIAQIVSPPERRTQISVERNGGSIDYVMRTQDGRVKRVSAATSVVDASVRVVAMGDGLANSPAYMIGTATPTNTEVAKPMVAWGKIRPIVQERRNNEGNQSRPWVWVGNRTDEVQKNLTVTYFFTADPARHPVVEMDHPRNLALVQRHIDGELWAFSITVPEVPAQSVFPREGMQIRLHYGDWTEWNSKDDPSNGVAIPLVAEMVLVQDHLGRLIWGDVAMATLLGSTAPSVIPDPPSTDQVAVSWQDNGEPNMIRPRLVIQNTGSAGTLVGGFKATVWLSGLGTRIDLPILEKWWDPNATGTIVREEDGRIRVDWIFSHSLAFGQQVQLGEWGIHWPGEYAPFDKSAIRATIELRDASGALVWSGTP